jgi:hypothetical protein
VFGVFHAFHPFRWNTCMYETMGFIGLLEYVTFGLWEKGRVCAIPSLGNYRVPTSF